jgi:hypothetical protein
MDGAWVDRLERRFGAVALPDLPLYVAGMTAAVGLLGLFKPAFPDRLALYPSLVLGGQVWRVLTFLIVPPPTGPLWLAFWVILLYWCLQALESAWGDFKFTVFLALGTLTTAAGALVTGAPFGNSMVILAAFLAFARLLPEHELLIMFVLPVKLRWLAVLAAVWIALELFTGPMLARVELLCGLAPYALFFGPGHWRDLRWAWRRWRGGSR